jgi:enoyl-CoA hydratase/carnithine racemase
MYETILTEESDGIALVTLNRPERLNAWTVPMGIEVRHAIAGFDARDDIRVVVVTGAGRAFCAGADLVDKPDGKAPDLNTAAAVKPFWEMNTPIIAAMNGAAVGAGMTVAMQWDFRVMAEDAKYGFVFNRRGLLPELASSWLLPRLVGLAHATDLLVTGRIFNGAEGARLGLANAAVPAASVLDRAMEIATDIATNVAPVSAALTKRLINSYLTFPDRVRAQQIDSALFNWTVGQEDAKEGMASFMEKRAPRWRLGKNADFPGERFEALFEGEE